MTKYGVQSSVFTDAIYVGRLNRDRTLFTDKETNTDMVLAAVAQYVERHYDGGMVAEFPGIGLTLTVKVGPIETEAS